MDNLMKNAARFLPVDLDAPASEERDEQPTRLWRTIWISDIHLGTRDCKADFLLNFLKHNDAETLYLVGDIIDGWALKKNWRWPQSHNDVVQKILRKARKGARVVFVPGNHDEFLRDYLPSSVGGVTLQREAFHTTADGRTLWVVHGDDFDNVVVNAKWLAKLGSAAYDAALWINRWFNHARRRLGYPYWSLSAYLKHKVKDAVGVMSKYEAILASEARKRGVDGVVCGHIHRAEIRDMDGVLYCNDGDWVESCTAMTEDAAGRLQILHWADEPAPVRAETPALAAV
jgi:UDP-2,3-diacylglucosamine pyrophosphatase LpxH